MNSSSATLIDSNDTLQSDATLPVNETSKTKKPSKVHIFLLCHGLWGESKHLGSMEQALIAKAKESTNEDEEVKVLTPASNAWTLTYDGVDFCAERLVRELDRLTEEYAEDGQRVTKFSCVGYSLGGLVVRYMIGLLEARTPSYFDAVEPVQLMTIASPAIGIPAYNTFWSPIFHALGSRLLSRTGRQLYARDRFSGKKPLLEVMADPRTSFIKALKRFRKVSIYANAINDRTVPYPTAGLSKTDPFALAASKAHKARRHRGAADDEPMDLREGGLKVTCHEDYPGLIKTYETIDPAEVDVHPSGKAKRRRRFPIPRLLKPSSYPFWPKPLRYAVVTLFPIVFPSMILLLIGRFLVHSFASNRRIRLLTVGELKTQEGRLSRVGLRRPSLSEDMSNFLHEALTSEEPGDEQLDGPKSTQPVLTDAQTRMIAGLSKRHVPQLELFLAYFPDAANAHGTIICRSPDQFPSHKDGLPILQHFVDHVVF